MEETEITIESIKKKAIKGIAILTGRNFVLQFITQMAVFALTVFLDPSQLGIFFLVSAVVNFFVYFSDIGLAAALIQKKDEITQADLKTTFTIQQIMVLSLVTIIFISTPAIRMVYSLDQESVYLLWALAISLFLSSLKTIPSVILERNLNFNRVIIPQIIETLVYSILVVVLAWKGFGITSFTIAVLARGVVGLISMYIVQPWMPGFDFSKGVLVSLLRFGLPYQLNTFLAVLKDDGLTIFLGTILGPSAIGFLGWAQKWGFAPLRFVMDPVIKVTFPAFARMQNNRAELSSAVAKSIFVTSLIVFPMLVGLVVMSPVLTMVIPKYQKWQPALVPLIFIAINAGWACVTTPLTNMLSAIGRITITFKLMVMWVILSWVLIPIMSIWWGLNGAAFGYALVSSSSFIAIALAVKFIEKQFLYDIGKLLSASIVMGLSIFFIGKFLPVSMAGVFSLIMLGIGIYIGLIAIIFGMQRMQDEFKRILIILR